MFIPPPEVQRLEESMPRGTEAVLAARGAWVTLEFGMLKLIKRKIRNVMLHETIQMRTLMKPHENS